MTDNLNRGWLLFDGDCGVCSALADMVKNRKVGKHFRVVPSQALGEKRLNAMGLTAEDCSKRVYVVTGSGRKYAGAFAVNYVLLKWFPWSILAVLIYLLPPLLLLEVIAYRLFANNRRTISVWLGLKACSLSSHKAELDRMDDEALKPQEKHLQHQRLVLS